MSTKDTQLLESEYQQLRAKLNSGLAKQSDVDRLADIQDELIFKFNYTWDELFMAQFSPEYLAQFNQ